MEDGSTSHPTGDSGVWWVELRIRMEADAAERVPGILSRWSGDLRQVLPDGTGFWASGHRVGLWAWAKPTLKEGQTPESAHARLVVSLRKRDHRVRMIARWGRIIDEWTVTLEAAPPSTPEPAPPRPPTAPF